jgi:hypothetical protein
MRRAAAAAIKGKRIEAGDFFTASSDLSLIPSDTAKAD